MLARDRLGVKPLYWARRGDLVVFASELKSVLASGLIEPELDYDAIDAYLTFGFVPGPRTPLEGVSKLLPGHRLVVDADGVRAERYWAYPQPAVAEPRLTSDEYAERLLELLEESVRLRLMSDVPLGAMLSGGLDSSLIVALMARNMCEPVKTFSVGFCEAGEGNELADARLVADALRHRPPRARALLPTTSIDLDDSSGISTSPSPTSVRSASSLSRSSPRARHRRALGPGRRRAPRRLLGSIARVRSPASRGVDPSVRGSPRWRAAGCSRRARARCSRRRRRRDCSR